MTTSPIKPAQKQINDPIKGTEIFRGTIHSSLTPLKAGDLSETYDRDTFWHRRGQRNNSFRNRKTKAKITLQAHSCTPSKEPPLAPGLTRSIKSFGFI